MAGKEIKICGICGKLGVCCPTHAYNKIVNATPEWEKKFVKEIEEAFPLDKFTDLEIFEEFKKRVEASKGGMKLTGIVFDEDKHYKIDKIKKEK
jgi:hypothetical protein